MFKNEIVNLVSDDECFVDCSVAKELKKMPLGFIDVGARGGAHDIVFPIARDTSVLAFEPDAEESKKIRRDQKTLSQFAGFFLDDSALGATKGRSTLNLLLESNNNSLRLPNKKIINRYGMDKWTVIGKSEIDLNSLDDILYSKFPHYLNFGELLKIDTQGTEYEILKGASRTLEERCVAVVSEVSFCELYKGQKLFSEVELLLRRSGFVFYGFLSMHSRSKKQLDKRIHWTRERAIYADAIFFKDPLAGKAVLSERQQKILFVVALLLNYYDFALELASHTWLKRADANEYNVILRLIKNLSLAPVADAVSAVKQLSREVMAEPDKANITVGAFVDRRRKICNFDDVLQISPLPQRFPSGIS